MVCDLRRAIPAQPTSDARSPGLTPHHDNTPGLKDHEKGARWPGSYLAAELAPRLNKTRYAGAGNCMHISLTSPRTRSSTALSLAWAKAVSIQPAIRRIS